MSMDDFGDILSDFGNAVSLFYDSIKNIPDDALTSAVTNTNILANLIKNMSGIDASGVDNFTEGIKKLIESGVSDFVSSFEGIDASVIDLVSNILNVFSTSIMSGQSTISAAFNTLISSAVNSSIL